MSTLNAESTAMSFVEFYKDRKDVSKFLGELMSTAYFDIYLYSLNAN